MESVGVVSERESVIVPVRRSALGVGRRLRVWVGLGLVLAMLSAAVVSSPAAAQDTGIDVRIVARKRDSGKVEFGLQEQQSDGSRGERLLPTTRLFPTTATVGRWLVSSPLSLSVANTEESVRIVARRLADGRVEFALQPQLADNSWGDRMLPSQRFFPTTARVGRWLQSSPLTIRTTAAPVEDQVMPANLEWIARLVEFNEMVSECMFNGSICRNPDFDVQIVIEAKNALYGCEMDPWRGLCSGMTREEFVEWANRLRCLEGWYHSPYDNQCHSTPQDDG